MRTPNLHAVTQLVRAGDRDRAARPGRRRVGRAGAAVVTLATGLSPLHTAVGRFVTRALAHFSFPAGGGAMAACGACVAVCGGASRLDCGAAGTVSSLASPVPPQQGDRLEAFGEAARARGTHSFFQWGTTGSAGNPWKSGGGCAKSLILEAIPSTSYPRFSTGCLGFSTGRISAGRRLPLSFSLSKSLKRKRKKQGKEQAERAQGHPRVGCIFPRVFASAYFFIHGFHGSEMANPWKSVEIKRLKINELGGVRGRSTDPQVALPVLPLRRVSGGRP